MATDVSSELSAGALIYLFADALISSDKGLARGVSVPCSDVKVKLRELNDTMIAASLWSLRRGGALNLEVSQKKKLMRTVTFVEVSYIKDIGAVGLEAQLLGAVERAGTESVTDVVMRWMGGRYDDPDQHVLTAVQQELVAAGLGSEGRRSGLRKLGGGMAFEPDCALIPGKREGFDLISSMWTSFRNGEADLASALVDSVHDAIGGSRETSA